MRPLIVHGMHGMGDNIHQRALVRAWLDQGRDVTVETPWPVLYHDLPVRLMCKGSRLRTQAKNARREAGRFGPAPSPLQLVQAENVQVSYSPQSVRSCGGVLQAMAAHSSVPHARDFRMPVPEAWHQKADALDLDDRPVMIYRPLMDRSEWGGCKARNPDHAAYRALFDSVRERYQVVSIADLEPGKEWLVEEMPDVDRQFHSGELDVETLAALYQRAHLVFTSPGFSVPLSQAVGAPVVCVFGGYENSSSFSAGAAYSPYLGIDPINPCHCFSHAHDCKKAIDLPTARARLAAFADSAAPARNRARAAAV